MRFILAFFLIFQMIMSSFQSEKIVIQCYYLSWSSVQKASFFPEHISPQLCTHITYAFAELDDMNFIIQPLNPTLDLEFQGGLGLYNRLTAIKSHNPKLKVLLGLGGFLDSRIRDYHTSRSKYSVFINSPRLWDRFIDHAITYLSGFGFDGLDIQWEYPKIEDRENLALFIKECKSKFDNHDLLLTLNLPTNPSHVGAYDLETISRYVDFVNLMTYEFGGYYKGFTNFISPLYANEQEYSVDKAVKMYLNLGLDPQKIVIGIATYAKSYMLQKAESNEVGSRVVGPGYPGRYTNHNGYLSYFEICGSDWYHVNDSSGYSGGYAFNHQQWAAYNDPISIRAKMAYVFDVQLLGVSFWSLNLDDYNALCREGNYPLINSAKNELNELLRKGKKPPFYFSVDRCMTDGFYQDNMDCRKFFECSEGILQSRSCGEPLYWNQTCQCCELNMGQCKN